MAVWDVNKVRDYILKNTKCKLISDAYSGINEDITLQCECGNVFISSLANTIKRVNGGKIGCVACNRSVWTPNKILEYIKNNSTSTLVSPPYQSIKKPMKFKCNCGNEFETMFKDFMSGKTQCDQCSGKNVWNIDFVKKYIGTLNGSMTLVDENQIFDNSSNTYIKLKCRCGEVFTSRAAKLDIRSDKSIKVCNICSGYGLNNISSIRKYVERNSDCKLISKSYHDSESKLTFLCSCGNYFDTTLDSFKEMGRGKGKRQCDECGLKIRAKSKALSHQEAIERIYEDVGDEYTLLEEYINMSTSVLMRHNECGNSWCVTLGNFLYQKTRCPSCYNSKGENKVRETLDSLKVEYIQEHIFDDCAHKTPLRFDFYLPKHNICVEYDGEQHFRPVGFGRKSEDEIISNFKLIQKRDNIKNKYCESNNIQLIRISYLDFNNIEEILNDRVKM